jgi:hypothetical protein
VTTGRKLRCGAADRPFLTTFGCFAFALGALVVMLAARAASAAAAIDCAGEAQALSKEEAELPRLEVASPADRPPYCITLETVMAFAGRVKTHVAHCPGSDYGSAAAQWAKTQTAYSKLFNQYRCKQTLRQLHKPIGAVNAR